MEKYIAGGDINISIAVENHDERPIDLSVLRFRVLYASLNFPVLKDELKWRRSIQPGDSYSSSEVFLPPDYAPPGGTGLLLN